MTHCRTAGLLLCLAPCALPGAAQALKPADPYAREPLVIVQSDMHFRFAADGTGSTEQTLVARIQGESTLKQLNVLAVPFASKSEHVEWIYARVRHADGTSTDTPIAGALEVVEPVTREAPFYSDLKQSQLPLRDLRLGDTLEWKAKVIRTSPEAPNAFWGQQFFQHDAIILSQTLELEVPKDTFVNVWSPKSKPVESTAGNLRTWQWTSTDTKLTVGPEADAAREADKKRVRTAEEELDFRKGKLPDVAWSTFKSWEAVGAWYRGMEGDRMLPDAEIKAKVAQLTAGKTTDEQKVQAVYNYVATQIHYIGVAFGIGRFQPHPAADVLGNQYGDCKDKHTLLAAMLEALGLQPDAVLIGVGIRFNEAVPSPAAFNHLITRVPVAAWPVWLDTTAEVAPYNTLIYATRDQQALVIPATGPAHIETTPARPPFPVLNTMDAKGTLDAEGTSTSRLTLTFHGDDEIALRAVLRQISPAQYDQFAQQICSSWGYSGTASHLEASRAEDTAQPLTISFDYKREKSGDWPNLRIVPQLAPVTLVRPDLKTPPVQFLFLGVPRIETSHAVMKIPAGWGVELPLAVHDKSDFATYDQTYLFKEGAILVDRRVEVLQERVPVSAWQTYSHFAERVDLGNDSFIQLTRTKASAAAGKDSAAAGKDDAATAKGDAPAAAVEDSPEAKALLTRAYDALREKNNAEADTLLTQVKALNPNQSGLWGLYGFRDFQQGNLHAAIADYQKELALHPANTGVYPALVQLQFAANEKDGARASLRQWSLADPANPQPALQLGNLQLVDGKPEEAARTAQTALDATPTAEKKNERLLMLLGQAELKAGHNDQGRQHLVALLKATEDPDLTNDVAYELADANLELPLAEQTTRAALDKMEQASQTWTLDEEPALLRRKSSMLQATWDTVGWIFFRSAKPAQAEPYISAAWKGRQDAEVARHLAELALARGDKNAALTDYELALATFRTYDALGVRIAPSAAQRAISARVDALRKQGARSSLKDPQLALTQVRTLPLGPAFGLDGVAEYKLLVRGDTVVRLEPSGDKRLTGGDVLLRNAHLPGLIPPGSPAQLMLLAMLNCHTGTCDLVLEP